MVSVSYLENIPLDEYIQVNRIGLDKVLSIGSGNRSASGVSSFHFSFYIYFRVAVSFSFFFFLTPLLFIFSSSKVLGSCCNFYKWNGIFRGVFSEKRIIKIQFNVCYC